MQLHRDAQTVYCPAQKGRPPFPMESKELVVARGLDRSIYVTPKGVGLVVWWGFHLSLIENA